jgi:hypothetical protein
MEEQNSIAEMENWLVCYHTCSGWRNHPADHFPMNQVFRMVNRKIRHKMKRGSAVVKIITNL